MTNEATSTNDERSAAPEGKSRHTYKIQIDKQFYEVSEPVLTGRELLALAGKAPAEQFALYLKVKGAGQPERIPLDKPVDLREPGRERFVTLPLDQTEG